ncbi:spidroin-2-like [Pristis pectinata]|uniref:spidroin-2-like n=1 Tax=Pristis pectinata TaxID=685728 RepID=UPI00223D305C|nr:spidroin-2-like [Pristis pectinata]
MATMNVGEDCSAGAGTERRRDRAAPGPGGAGTERRPRDRAAQGPSGGPGTGRRRDRAAAPGPGGAGTERRPRDRAAQGPSGPGTGRRRDRAAAPGPSGGAVTGTSAGGRPLQPSSRDPCPLRLGDVIEVGVGASSMRAAPRGGRLPEAGGRL